MAYRRQGILLDLERRVLEVAVRRSPGGVYGFALAQDLAAEGGASSLTAHGTLYKALDRMRRAGLLTAEWEDADAAVAAGRPRRRIYAVTAKGARALREGPAADSRTVRLGEVPP